jgi:Uma2 family endonuclease
MGLPQRDTRRHTYAEYLTWPEEFRYELIDGIAYLMSPAPNRLHQRLVVELCYQIRAALEGMPCQVYVAPLDVRLPKGTEKDDEVDTVVQPAVLIVRDEAKLDDRGVRGAPDWLVEILSPKTVEHDLTIKVDAYERAAVPEVWFIHPTDRLVVVYRLENGRYGRPMMMPLQGRSAIKSVPGVTIDWDRMALTP